jgi:hypothetical protein
VASIYTDWAAPRIVFGDADDWMQCDSAMRSFIAAHYDAVIRVYAEAGDVIGTHEHAGDFKAW